MSWVWLDDEFHSSPKVVAMGLSGAGLYARALCYCGAYLTDGFVALDWLRGVSTPKLRQRLVEVDAWTEVPGGYRIPGYLILNPSREEVEAKREKRSEAGQQGAKKRWQTHSPGYGIGNGDRARSRGGSA